MRSGRRTREISVSQEALILKRAAHATCIIVDKTRGRRNLTDPERAHLAHQATAILNAVLLNYGTALSEFVLKYSLRETSGHIVLAIAREYSLDSPCDLMRDLLQDLEILSKKRWLSSRRTAELLRFWQRFHELAEGVETKGLDALHSPAQEKLTH
jgi:hypothetical protein